jgi:hypothetical protein
MYDAERVTGPDDHEVERGELIEPDAVVEATPVGGEASATPERSEFIEQPAKVMRVGTMMKQLLEEVRSSALDEASRERLRSIFETSVLELGQALSPDLRDELGRLALPFADDDTPPSKSELQIAQAQLVGWLEGLIQGIQATLFAQQMAAQQQLANMRGGAGPGQLPRGAAEPDGRPGTYL